MHTADAIAPVALRAPARSGRGAGLAVRGVRRHDAGGMPRGAVLWLRWLDPGLHHRAAWLMHVGASSEHVNIHRSHPDMHAACALDCGTIRQEVASCTRIGTHVVRLTRVLLWTLALDRIGAVEYDAEARSISLPLTVALTVSGPIGANASSVVLLGRLCSAFRLPRSLIIGERGFMPECGVRSPSMDWVASDPARRVAPAAIERLSALIDDGLPAVVAHDARWYAVA
ncbi:MAG: hypothetical protein KJS95_11950, partial [Gammaproteobacteria bacterium]|nr:hypothetical protein [Gammaproteobacteria bacterium]